MRAKESPFIVQLREIPPAGLRRDWDLSGDFARVTLADTEADADTAKLAARAELTRSGVEVLARGQVGGEVMMLCSRCAGPARITLETDFEVLFLPRDADVPEAGEESPDVATYENEALDLEETLREEVLVALPYAPLCDDNCKGLCPNCGKDLNEGPCDCPEIPRDERLAALRNIKID